MRRRAFLTTTLPFQMKEMNIPQVLEHLGRNFFNLEVRVTVHLFVK